MADEKVKYEFQGDISSLKRATQGALGQLHRFQLAMDRINSGGIAKAAQGVQKSVGASMGKVLSVVDSVQKKFRSMGDVKMPRSSAAFTSTREAASILASTLGRLSSSNTVATKTLQELATGSENTLAGFKRVVPAFETLISKGEQFNRSMSNSSDGAQKPLLALSGVMSNVKSAFNSMGASVGSVFKGLGDSFSPLVSKLQGFKDKAASVGGRVSQVFTIVASAFRRTSDGTEGASRSQDKLGKSVDGVKEKLDKQQKELKETSDGYKQIEKSSGNAASSMLSGAGSLTSAFGAVKNIVSGIVDSFFALAGVQLGDLLSEGAKSAIDYVENLNLFQVAMGSSIDKGKAFVEQMQEVYGMDPSNVYRYAGYFYQLTDAIGMSEDASATMSLSMTKAANDLASLFNTDIQTVVNDLSSGMMGMSRTVRKYGMDIRTTTLQQTALKYGIEGEVESMTEANRQALRYITMLEQAQNALHQTTEAVDGTSTELGDFARNIETPANQLRIFKEQMSQLGRAVGNFIVAPLQSALPYINGFVMSLRVLVNYLATLKGVAVSAGNSLSSAGDDADDAADKVDSISGAASDAAKKLKQLIAPFDELNVLQDSSSSDALLPDDALDPKLSAVLAEMELNLENINMKANQVRDSILGFLGLELTTDPITGEQIFQWDKEAFMTNVMGSLEAFKAWFEDLSPMAQGAIVIGGLTLSFSTLASLVPKIISGVTLLASAFSFLATPAGTAVLIVGTVIGALALLLTSSEEFRTSFIGLFSEVGTSLQEWGVILGGVFTTVGTDLVAMWGTHIQPTIEAIGTALAPALSTLGSLWQKLSKIIGDVFALIGNLWTTVLKPVLEFALDIIQDLCEIFQVLWEEFVGPIAELISDSVTRLWNTYLKPIIEKIIKIIGNVITILKALWDNVLAPIVKFLVNVFAPAFRATFQAIWNIIEFAINMIMDIIDTLLGVFSGVIEFLAGVFTGDWKKALSGLLNIFVALGNGIIGVVENAINFCISIINSFLTAVIGGIKGLINGLGGLIEDIAGFLGFDIDLSVNFSVPQIPKLSIPRIPEAALYTGGVVSGPTRTLLGEGPYREAVIPLDDSPQMNDLIDKIAEAVNGGGSADNSAIEVRVFIGDKEFDAYTYKASERGKKIVGKQPIKIGG